MKKTIVLIVISILTVCCDTSKEPITITFAPSTEDVYLHYNESWNTISAVSIPFNFDIENNRFHKEQLVRFSYNYGNAMEGQPVRLFLRKDKSFEKLKNSEDIYIDRYKTNPYRVRTKHYVDTTKSKQAFFEPYMKDIQRLNQDSLNIGTVSELEAKHKELLDNLLQNDSLSFLFLDENSETGFRKKTKSVEY
ncbi:hypothetical protein [uncultured Zobellia sp.]|uniref:hypothetical protein n=1 Tax=uncultured Zobellia sp. TaxID=255433 RepID=UPI0025949DDC|nr:hypothetical protein [uncultured Zobellia sp.]